LVTVTTQMLPEGKAEQYGVQGIPSYARANIEDFAKLAELFDAGKHKVFVDRTFPLAEAQAALDAKRGGNQHGKIVITVA
jgi:NADPH:quinone reductase-like Zn-dependent oxidoreductase